MVFALKSHGWNLYVATAVNGGVKYVADTAKAKTFKTHAAANAYRRKNERGWGWTVVAVSN